MRRPRVQRGKRFASLVALGLALAGHRASADDAVTIVQVHSSNAPLDKRLDAELEALGFAVKGVEPAEAPFDLEAVAKSYGAAAALRVDPGDVVELLVLPRHAQDPPVRESVQVDARRGWNAAAVSALESLRARLLEIRSTPAPPPPRAPVAAPLPAPPPAVEPLPAPAATRRCVWVHVGLGMDGSPGGVPLGADVLVEVRMDPTRWLSVAGFGAGTPFAAELDAPEGKASVRRVIAGVAVDVQRTLGRTTLGVGAGAALIPAFVRGTYAAPGFATRDSSSLTAAPVLRLSVSVAVGASLRARFALAGGVTFPEATATFGDHDVATWGRPFGLGTLGIEWGVGSAAP